VGASVKMISLVPTAPAACNRAPLYVGAISYGEQFATALENARLVFQLWRRAAWVFSSNAPGTPAMGKVSPMPMPPPHWAARRNGGFQLLRRRLGQFAARANGFFSRSNSVS